MIQPILISLFTVIAVRLLDQWENKHIKTLFDWVPAILLAYLFPALISELFEVDYSASQIHQWSKNLLIPLAIVAVMSSLSFQGLKAIGYKPILLFLSGSLAIAVLPIILLVFYDGHEFIQGVLIQENYWKGIPPIVGSWIGGSTSQLVLKELIDTPEEVFLSILVMDNILVNIWTILMFQLIKKSEAINRILKIDSKTLPLSTVEQSEKPISKYLVIAILFAVVGLVDITIEPFIGKIIALSIVGLLMSNYIKKWNFDFVLKMGGLLILMVMAVLGLKLNFDHLTFNGHFFGFLIVWMLAQFTISIIVAKLLNINFAWVPIASMANVGGIATAPAVTAAYEKKWMPHAIVLAILSMATGTFWGLLTIDLFERFFL